MSKMKKILPEIRFPEFAIDSGWTIAPLSEVYSLKITNSFSRDKLNYLKGTVKNIHYGDIHTKFSTLFDITKETVPYINSDIPIDRIEQDNYCTEGDIVFADASEDMDDVGKSIEIVNLNNEQLLAGLHTFLARQIEPNLIVGFGGYLFKSNSIRTQIKRESQGAKVLGISKGRISDINIYYPENKEEQKKIASCLTALDELIVAHNDKLETLKDHKKSLMQNLFPQEGQKVPNYRFPEFENDGVWTSKPIEKVFSIFQGYAFSSNDSASTGTRWLKIADVGIQEMKHHTPSYLPLEFKEEHKRFLLKKGDYVLALTRPILSNQLKIAPVDKTYHNSLLNQRVGKLVTINVLSFVYYLLQTTSMVENISRNIAGNEPPNLSFQQISDIKVFIPKEKTEQQKIASCLSAVDELITAQTNKIEQLQQHKKGLMQGLFPKIEN